ncbi:MAG: 50S ribosomal protein L13 [Nitrospinota bacterium]|nr:50S ribosomal protein L13 [Nitrospinota bacterium]
MKTFSAKKEDIKPKWHLIDANGEILGRLAVTVAKVIRGKHKPTFTPHVDTGDFVIIVNADKVRLTGNKLKDKMYYRHTGYPGGIRSMSAEKLLQKKPEEVLRKAIRGMLPKNSLGRQILKKAKIYASADHPHSAQQPVDLVLN